METFFMKMDMMPKGYRGYYEVTYQRSNQNSKNSLCQLSARFIFALQ